MTYTVLHIRHAEDMQKRTCVSYQCRTRAGAGRGTAGFGGRDSREAFWRDFPASLPLFGIGSAKLSTGADPGRKSCFDRAASRRADQPAPGTASTARTVVERLRGRRPICRTGSGEGPWVSGAQSFASYLPKSRTVSICKNSRECINCLYRRTRPVWNRTA